MKKLIALIAIAVLAIAGAAEAYAANSGVVNVTVTIERSVSIDIAGGPLNFGSVATGATAVSSSPIVITNNGSGTDEVVTLSASDPAGWTNGTPGVDSYRLTYQVSEDGLGETWQSAGEVSETIAYNEAKKLWIKLEVPTATNVTTKQTIPVTITAE